MENYGEVVITPTVTARYETKIETFDPCMIDIADRHERNIVQQQSSNRMNRMSMSQEEEEDVTEIQQEGHETRQSQEDIQQPSGQVATIQPNAMTNMTLTPVRLPALLDGEFFSVVRVEDSNVTVRCLQCDKLLNGNLKSTGNFLSHIKRVHPFMIERIKCKSNQRKPAIAYVNMTSEKSADIAKTKRAYRKCYKQDEGQMPSNGDAAEQAQNWPDTPMARRRKYDDMSAFTPESPEIQKLSQNNSFVVEDEFDAIGRNVAAKLRNMRLDQRIVAEKLLNDVLFEAQLGTLHRDSSLHI